MRIDVYSHGYTVRGLSINTRAAAAKLCRFLGHFELTPNEAGRYEQKLTAVYAGAFGNREQFCFHRATLDKFLAIVRDCAPEVKPEIIEHDVYESVEVDIQLKDLREPRWGQPGAIEYGVADGPTKMICLGPGRGKTFVFNRITFHTQRRSCMIIRAQYVDKWIEDIKAAHEATDDDILVIRGSKALAQMMLAAEKGDITAKYILISNSTYRNYLSLYEHSNGAIKNHGFPFAPQELMGALGVEILGIDEVHQDFHFNHRCIIYNHVAKIVCLSGTLDPDNAFKDEVVRLTFPVKDRYVEPPPPPYIEAAALQYKLRNPNQLKWKNRGRPDYSQAAFENSLIKNKKALENYVNMLVDITRIEYLKVYKPGRKALVFCATKLMCTIVSKAMQKAFPDKVVKRYIGEDPLIHTREGEIIVSTTKSCGTAIDIPGLATSIMSEAVNDTQANLQHIKRLREPAPGPDYFTPKFLYMLCIDIPQHMNYHKRKMEIFRNEVKSHQLLITDYII